MCAQIRSAAQNLLLTQLQSYYDDNILSSNQGSVLWFQVSHRVVKYKFFMLKYHYELFPELVELFIFALKF